ncbi:unnamed protein product, partial [Scytosiphon promiscuus]
VSRNDLGIPCFVVSPFLYFSSALLLVSLASPLSCLHGAVLIASGCCFGFGRTVSEACTQGPDHCDVIPFLLPACVFIPLPIVSVFVDAFDFLSRGIPRVYVRDARCALPLAVGHAW